MATSRASSANWVTSIPIIEGVVTTCGGLLLLLRASDKQEQVTEAKKSEKPG